MKYVNRGMGDAADASSGKFDAADTAKAALAAAAIIAIIAGAVSLSANLLAAHLPDKMEREYLSLPAKALLPDAEDSGEPPQRAVDIFRQVLDGVCARMPCRDLNYRLQYIDYEKQPNAFAVPGGDVFITAGLLDEVRTEAGLAFVLAHEIAHHNKRHVLKLFWRDVLWALVLGLSGVDGGGVAYDLSQRHYSRELETEADLYAINALYPLYGDKEDDYLEFFIRMNERMQDNTAQQYSDFISTHPGLEQRIEYVRQTLAELRRTAEADAQDLNADELFN